MEYWCTLHCLRDYNEEAAHLANIFTAFIIQINIEITTTVLSFQLLSLVDIIFNLPKVLFYKV